MHESKVFNIHFPSMKVFSLFLLIVKSVNIDLTLAIKSQFYFLYSRVFLIEMVHIVAALADFESVKTDVMVVDTASSVVQQFRIVVDEISGIQNAQFADFLDACGGIRVV